ncbi:MAG: MraY family glycosyltransferase [Actinomycetaceae bacterium]|nr:MraY family glycosyltransferase [Actinomycetaceae bacterium]
MKAYLLIVVVAAVLTYLCVPIVRHIALATNTVAKVRERDSHVMPTPRLGGVAMFIGFAGALFLAMQMGYLAPAVNVRAGWGVLVGAAGVTLLGILDDIWDLDWMTKLAGQVLAAGIMSWMGVQLVSFPIFGLTIGSSRLSLIATILVVVVAINAVNFVDGLDGLAAGMIGIGGVGLFIYSYSLTRLLGVESYASLATTVVAAMVGICIGFLPHNFSPASIFMGDSGAMLLGLLAAASAIIITGQIDPANIYFRQAFPAFLPIVLPLAVLAIPMADMIMAVFRRLRAHQSPFHPDSKHLHHRLWHAGRSRTRAVVVMYLWTAIFSLGAASMVLFRMRYVAAMLGAATVLGLVVTVELLPGLKNWFRSRAGREWVGRKAAQHQRRTGRQESPEVVPAKLSLHKEVSHVDPQA